MIFCAIITGSSILGVWFATLGPAILIVIIYCFLNAWAARKMPIVPEEKFDSFKEQMVHFSRAGIHCIPVMLLPFFIFGCLYSGLIESPGSKTLNPKPVRMNINGRQI